MKPMVSDDNGIMLCHRLFKFSCHKDFTQYTTMSEDNLKLQESESSFIYLKKRYFYYEAMKRDGKQIDTICDPGFKSIITIDERVSKRNGAILETEISFEFDTQICNTLFNCVFIFANNKKK